jgi:hypothetical protein
VPAIWVAGSWCSGVVDLEAAADGGDGVEVAGVGADDQIPAAQRAIVDACVDDVGGRGLEAHSGSADTPWGCGSGCSSWESCSCRLDSHAQVRTLANPRELSASGLRPGKRRRLVSVDRGQPDYGEGPGGLLLVIEHEGPVFTGGLIQPVSLLSVAQDRGRLSGYLAADIGNQGQGSRESSVPSRQFFGSRLRASRGYRRRSSSSEG